MREGDVRRGAAGTDLGPEDARALLRAWLVSMDLDIDEHELLELLQEGELSHPDLYRRARRIHERKLAEAVHERSRPTRTAAAGPRRASATALFDACMPAIPYAAAAAFLGREKFKLTRATATGRGWRWSPTASAGCTASPTRSSRSASAACPASRSR